MFTVQCDSIGREVLLGNRDITAVRNMDEGILVAYSCACGQEGVLLSGAGVDVERSGHVAERVSA